MSSVASIKNTGNSSASAGGAANTRPPARGNAYAALAVDGIGPDILGDGMPAGTHPQRPPAVAAAAAGKTANTNKQPFPPVDYADAGTHNVKMFANVDHPTDPESRTPAVKFHSDKSKSTHNVSVLENRAGRWGMFAAGTLSDMIASGDVSVYCTPTHVFPYGKFGSHTISFFTMLKCAIVFMSKDPATSDFAEALKNARESGKRIILDDGVLSIRGSGMKKIPKKKSKTDSKGWTHTGTKKDAVAIKAKVDATKPELVPAATAHPGEGNKTHFAIAKGHGIAVEFTDGKYNFTINGSRISKASLIKRGFIVARTPEGGAIIMPKLEDATMRQAMKLQLMRDCLLYNTIHGTAEEKAFAQNALTNWKTIFIAKVDGKFAWLENLPQKVKVPAEHDEVANVADEVATEQPAAKKASFASMAAKEKPRPPPPAHKPPTKPVLEDETESEDESEVTEAFPGLPQMTGAQKAKQEADKIAYLAKVKDEEIQRLKDELAKSQSKSADAEPELVMEEIPVPEVTTDGATNSPPAKRKGKRRFRKLEGDELAGLFN